MRGLAIAVLLPLALAGCIRPPFAPGWYHPAKPNLAAREEFRDARLGLLFLWGPHSVLGEGEAALNEKRMGAAEYEKQAEGLNGKALDPKAWGALAKEAGARYIELEAKGPDGFAMFDSKLTKWDAVDASGFKHDALKQLAEAGRKQDLKVFLRYSELDWHHPDYFPLGKTGRDAGRPAGGKWWRYLKYRDGQVKELLSDYGAIDGLRLEGAWDRPEADWKHEALYRMIHREQPGLLLGNAGGTKPEDGEDVLAITQRGEEGLEQAVKRAAGFKKFAFEYAEPLGGAWGYRTGEKEFKPSREVLRNLIRVSGSGGNLLLGVGVKPDGTIPPEAAQRLKEIGRWLARNGQSLYDTRGGPIEPGEWGVSTHTGDKVYLHYLAQEPGMIAFPSSLGDVHAAYMFTSGVSLDVTLSGDKYSLEIPARIIDPIDTIIVLELRGTESTEK